MTRPDHSVLEQLENKEFTKSWKADENWGIPDASDISVFETLT